MNLLGDTKERKHYGIILNNGDENDWDSGGTAFGSIFVDKDDPKKIYLYYTGANNRNWEEHAHCAIGLSTSSDGIHFRKLQDNPILEGPSGSFCVKEALTPAVAKLNNKYYMIFSGKPHAKARRGIGIAYADDPKGPWEILGQIIKPKESWEGYEIDCGTCIIPQGNSILFYYSNCLATRSQAIINWFRSPSFTPPLRFISTFKPRIRYTVRRIGIGKVEVVSKNASKMRVSRFPGNPLQHLNGKVGSWNESIFCPGYLKLSNKHLLFPTTATYSIGFPYKQYIGVVESTNPFFNKNESGKMRVMIDGPKDKKYIMPSIKSEIALDTPSPLLRNGKLYLYYSVMSREKRVWKIALTVYPICAYEEE
jgi:sucrose-6-phosphate hydrolase SacC (GH32 family)